MIKLLIYLLIGYVLWRSVRPVFTINIKTVRGTRAPQPRRHAADFSDVKDADFEDITPPRNGSGSPSGS